MDTCLPFDANYKIFRLWNFAKITVLILKACNTRTDSANKMKLTPIYFAHPVYMCEQNQPGILNRFWVIAFQKRGTNFSDTLYIYI